MNDSDAQKAFSLLASMTDKIFEHVADIRNLLNTTCIPVTENLSDDPPPYESFTFEQLIDQLKKKVNCLEDLNKQRKLLCEQYSNERNQCKQSENVHSDHTQQAWNMKGEFKLPHASTRRDAAIKNLRSYLRSRQAAAKTNRMLLAQIKQGLSDLGQESFKWLQNSRAYEWYPEEEKKLYAESRLMGLFTYQLTEDQYSLLRNGKILEEQILSVSRDRGEESMKLMRSVEDSYRQAEQLIVPTFFDLVLPILRKLPDYEGSSTLKPVLNSVVRGIIRFSDLYVKVVEAYQDALQDLADLLVP